MIVVTATVAAAAAVAAIVAVTAVISAAATVATAVAVAPLSSVTPSGAALGAGAGIVSADVEDAAEDVRQPHDPERAQPPREGTAQLLPELRRGRAPAVDPPRLACQRPLRLGAAMPAADASAQPIQQPRLADVLLRQVRLEVLRKPLERRRRIVGQGQGW